MKRDISTTLLILTKNQLSSFNVIDKIKESIFLKSEENQVFIDFIISKDNRYIFIEQENIENQQTYTSLAYIDESNTLKIF